MPVHNRFCAPSEDVYCKRKLVEMAFVVTPGGIEGEHVFKVAPSSKLLPGRFKIRGNFQLNSVQENSQKSKLIAAPMVKGVGNHRT